MSNHIVKKQETIDVNPSEIKEVKDTAEEKEVKMSFTEKHPVAWRRIKKVMKIVGGLAAVGGTVYAGQKIADSKRHYYTISLTPTPDGGADGTIEVAPAAEGDTVVVTEPETTE